MTPDLSHLDRASNYTGKDRVVVGNGASLPITHTGTISPTPSLELLDVLVVPRLTKNLLSISKLTSGFPPLAITFTNNFFLSRIVKREGWWQPVKDMVVYMCWSVAIPLSFLFLKIRLFMPRMIYGMLVLDMLAIISLLNKNDHLYLTSLLPSLSLCNVSNCKKSLLALFS